MKRKNNAFSLMELLVVIAIIMILAGLLMPALNRSRNLAQRTRCANNLKQIGIALRMYAGDNSGLFPTGSWGERLFDNNYVDNEDVFDCPAITGTGNKTTPDYAYTSGLGISTTSSVRVATCNSLAHDGFCNKLYVDGRVVAATTTT